MPIIDTEMNGRSLALVLPLCLLAAGSTGCRQVAKLLFGKATAYESRGVGQELAEKVALEAVGQAVAPNVGYGELDWLSTAAIAPPPVRLPAPKSRALAIPEIDVPAVVIPPDVYARQAELQNQWQASAQLAEMQRQQQIQLSIQQHYQPPLVQPRNGYR